MIDARGTETLITYNQQNLPTEVRVKNSSSVLLKKTTYTYNTVGWLLSKDEYTLEGTEWVQSQTASSLTYANQVPAVYTTSYTYNKRGQKESMTNPRG